MFGLRGQPAYHLHHLRFWILSQCQLFLLGLPTFLLHLLLSHHLHLASQPYRILYRHCQRTISARSLRSRLLLMLPKQPQLMHSLHPWILPHDSQLQQRQARCLHSLQLQLHVLCCRSAQQLHCLLRWCQPQYCQQYLHQLCIPLHHLQLIDLLHLLPFGIFTQHCRSLQPDQHQLYLW